MVVRHKLVCICACRMRSRGVILQFAEVYVLSRLFRASPRDTEKEALRFVSRNACACFHDKMSNLDDPVYTGMCFSILVS